MEPQKSIFAQHIVKKVHFLKYFFSLFSIFVTRMKKKMLIFSIDTFLIRCNGQSAELVTAMQAFHAEGLSMATSQEFFKLSPLKIQSRYQS